MRVNRESREADAEAIAFGGFRLDRRAGQLTCAGDTIPLRPKTRAVLVPVCEWFGTAAGTPDVVEARTLLGELGSAGMRWVRVGRSGATPHRTPR